MPSAITAAFPHKAVPLHDKAVHGILWAGSERLAGKLAMPRQACSTELAALSRLGPSNDGVSLVCRLAAQQERILSK